VSESNASAAPIPETAAARDRARRVALAWWSLGACGFALGFVTLSAAASLVAEGQRSDVAGLVVGAIAGGLALGVPLLLGAAVVRALQARGYAALRRPIYATCLALVNVAYVLLLQATGPRPVSTLWLERGTWVFDAWVGRGPFGPAAVPTVRAALGPLQAAHKLRDVIPLWCDEGAAAFADGLAAGLAADGPAPLAETLRSVVGRYSGSPDGQVAGRALLSAVADVALGSFPDLDLPALGTVDPTPTSVERTTIGTSSPGWVARYEEGAWRWCPGPAAELRASGQLHATALREEVRRVPVAAEPAAGPWDASVRAALQAAVLGRAAWLAGSTTALDRSWSASLTPPAAFAQAERLRRWCGRVAAGDPAQQALMDAFYARWNLPSGAPLEEGQPPVEVTLDPGLRSLLEGQGRSYLADLVDACKPMVGDRQLTERAGGLDVSEDQRRRWAEGEARAAAGAARLTDQGEGGVTVEVDGRVLRATQDEGSWRLDWRE
jgi:hypothetical protein